MEEPSLNSFRWELILFLSDTTNLNPIWGQFVFKIIHVFSYSNIDKYSLLHYVGTWFHWFLGVLCRALLMTFDHYLPIFCILEVVKNSFFSMVGPKFSFLYKFSNNTMSISRAVHKQLKVFITSYATVIFLCIYMCICDNFYNWLINISLYFSIIWHLSFK